MFNWSELTQNTPLVITFQDQMYQYVWLTNRSMDQEL